MNNGRRTVEFFKRSAGMLIPKQPAQVTLGCVWPFMAQDGLDHNYRLALLVQY
jgi:hypothetical protein